MVPALDGELLVLCVDPAETGLGHGSRLVNAAADLMPGPGSATCTSGWASRSARVDLPRGRRLGADGAVRTLDLRGDGDVVVDQFRLRTSLEERERRAR